MLTAPGIGSGLDINGIVSQLMELERRPLQAMEQKQFKLSVQLSAYGQLKSSLSSFQSAMQQLSEADSFKKFSASSSNGELLGVQAGSDVVPGSYRVQVNRLAQVHKLGSGEFSATDTFGGNPGDALSIQVGSDASRMMQIDLSTASTLSEIRDAINGAADNPGVSATIINGNGGNQKLVITSEESGQVGAITLGYGGSLDATSFGFQTVNDVGGDLSLLDSELVIDGYVVNRSTNRFDDVIQGITLDLKKAEPGTEIVVEIERDLNSTVRAVEDFADAYNELRAVIRGLREDQLQADSALLLMENKLRGVLNGMSDDGVFRHLSEVGVSLQKDGSMTVDTTKLKNALESDTDAVAGLFSDEKSGYAIRFDQVVDNWLVSDGLLDSRTDGINARMDRVEDQKQSMERRLEQIEARYLRQFNAMDSLVTQLNGMSAYLSQQLAVLPGAQQ